MRINLNEGQLSAIFFLISSGIGISLSIGGHFGWAWLILILSSALYLVFASDVFRRLAARNPRVNALAPPTQGWNHMRFSIIVIGGFCSCFPLVMMILLLNAKIAFDIEAISGSLKGSQADIFHLDAVAFTFFILIWMLLSIIGTLATEFEKLIEAHITTQVQIAENLAQQRNANDVIS